MSGNILYLRHKQRVFWGNF